MKYTYKYDLTSLTELLNPNNTISAHRYLAHSIGMTETIIYSALISRDIYIIILRLLRIILKEKPGTVT